MIATRQSIGIRLRYLLREKIQDRIRTSNNRVVLFARSWLGQPYVTLGKVSVVVPIYNVERYLEECLESIRIQSYPDLEILMINDGSLDTSKEIARLCPVGWCKSQQLVCRPSDERAIVQWSVKTLY